MSNMTLSSGGVPTAAAHAVGAGTEEQDGGPDGQLDGQAALRHQTLRGQVDRVLDRV